MKTIAVVIIHGIGINKADFADDLVNEVKAEFNNRVTLELKERKDYSQFLLFQPIVWDSILGERQKALAEQIRLNMAKFAKPISGNWWDKFSGFVLRWVNQLVRGDFAAQFIMDIISYGDEPTRQMIFKHIETDLNKADDKAPVTLIAHSLGTVIATDFIREKKLKFDNLFTMGSPIQLFSLQYGETQFKPPVRCESAGGRWINIFDSDDPIAYRLEDVSDEYKKAAYLKDHEVDCGVFGQAHIGYWKDKTVQEIIAAKLALDWLKLNEQITDEKYDQQLAEFDKKRN
jgi:hypothetical protein